MIRVEMHTAGAYRTNTYLFWQEDSKSCCVVDPGYEPEAILQRVSQLGLTVEAILLTHAHFDHVGGVKAIAADTDCRVYICPEDLNMSPMMTSGKLYYTDTYTEGTRLNLAGCDILVLHTPGHTAGSVCLLTDGLMFSGDTLFAGTCGRTDLPGGSEQQMAASLARLAKLEGDWQVLPGHGPISTLEQERKTNSYLPA